MPPLSLSDSGEAYSVNVRKEVKARILSDKAGG